jgi:hypothetical protein
MLSENSILRRLPPGMNHKDLVFLDGIRYAGEIAGLAYLRLDSILTGLASSHTARTSQTYTAAFLDAWALVDAIDRSRLLWKLLPGRPATPPDPTVKSFDELAQPVRALRNVADHLAQRADYIAASGNPVLGLLSWVTHTDDTRAAGHMCMLAAGTLKRTHWIGANAADGGHFHKRTGMIHLAAGEHRANLSTLMPEMGRRIAHLETSLTEQIRAHGLEGKQAGGDHFIALAFTAKPGSTAAA